MINFPKLKTVDTTNLQPGEIIHMYFALYDMISIRGFTSMLTVVCENTIMLWVFPTESKKSLFHIISFILTTLKNQ